MSNRSAIRMAALLLTATLAPGASTALAQNKAPSAAAGMISVPAAPKPGSYSRLSGTSNPALEFYSRGRTISHAPQQQATAAAPAVTQPVETAPIAKPFNAIQQGPNISPYLALNSLETSVGPPAYYTMVRPMLEQQRFAQQQQAQNLRMQQQLRSASAMGAMNRGINGGLPTTGHSTQYFNLGGFYSTPR